MFKELVPILRQRAVLLTVTFLEGDQIRVNIVPKKIKDGDNDALTTPLSVTGTAEELDTELASTIVSFVTSHLQLKNTLEKAKAEMDEAAVGTVRTEEGQIDAGLCAFWDLHRSRIGAQLCLHPTWVSGIDLDFGVFEFRGKMNGEGVDGGFRRIIGE